MGEVNSEIRKIIGGLEELTEEAARGLILVSRTGRRTVAELDGWLAEVIGTTMSRLGR